jgi:hypothetical protein
MAFGFTVWSLVPYAPVSAQSDWQAWPSITVHQRLDNRFKVSAEGQLRFVEDISRLDVALIRLDIEAKLSSRTFTALGYDYFGKVAASAQSENRIWQQIRHEYSAEALLLGNRFRIEERFIENVDGMVIRGRYRLRLDYPLAHPAWGLVASNEVFLNLNAVEGGPSRGFNQNRLFGGFDFRFSNRFRLETGLQWRLEDDVDDYILILGLTFDTQGW